MSSGGEISDREEAGSGALRWLRTRHVFLIECFAAAGLAGAMLTLGVTAGSAHQNAEIDPGQRGWGLGARMFNVSADMSPYAFDLADRLGRGRQGWTPTGIEGWGVYDLSTPQLIERTLSPDDARALNDLVKPAGFPIPPMPAFSLDPETADYGYALDCLTQAIYYEAGFEPGEGQQAVAQVVLNRVRHPGYPGSVCGVVYQGSHRTTGCQFSFTCDGSLTRIPEANAWSRARAVAAAALNGAVYEGVGAATHYHADYVFPYWAVTLVKLDQIGAHIFYRIAGPSGAPAGFTGRYAGGEADISMAVLMGGDALTPDAPTAVELPESLQQEPTLVTLSTGGQTRTYIVDPKVPAPVPVAPLPDVAALDLGVRPEAQQSSPFVGATIRPSRRMPSAEEVQDINERLRQFELKSADIPLVPGAPPGS